MLNKRIIIHFLILFLSSFVYGQNNIDSVPYKELLSQYKKVNTDDLDLEEQIVEKLVNLAISRGDNFFLSQFYFYKAALLYYKNDLVNSKLIALKSYKLAVQYNNYNALMVSQNILGALDYIADDFVAAEKWYLNKIKIAKVLKDTVSEMETYYNLGLIYAHNGKYLESAESSFKAIKYFENKRDTFNLMYQYQSLAGTYINLQDNPSALKYLFKAASLCKKPKNNYQLAGILVDLAKAYTMEGIRNNDSVFKYLNQSIELSKSSDDEFHYAIAISAKANNQLIVGKYTDAIRLAYEAVDLNNKSSRILALCENYTVLSGCFLKAGKLDSSLFYARKGYTLALKQNKIESLLDVTLTISKIYETKKQYDSSLKYHQLYFDHYEAVQKNTQLRGMAKKELTYEKETQDMLRAKEKLIAQTKLEKQKQISLIIIIASILLIILLIISYRNYRLKNKANIEILNQKRLLEEKQKEILDSIQYAKRIQMAQIPSEKRVESIIRKVKNLKV